MCHEFQSFLVRFMEFTAYGATLVGLNVFGVKKLNVSLVFVCGKAVGLVYSGNSSSVFKNWL